MPNMKQMISKPYDFAPDFNINEFSSNMNQFQDNQAPGFMNNMNNMFDPNMGYKPPKIPQASF